MSSKPVDYVEIPLRKGTTRGQIPQNFVPEESVNSDDVGNSANLDYLTWSMSRYHPSIF